MSHQNIHVEGMTCGHCVETVTQAVNSLDGRVVGINTAIAEIGAGVGFAIPAEMATRIADDLIDKGTVERGWLGVGIQTLTPELAVSFNVSQVDGVLVNDYDPSRYSCGRDDLRSLRRNGIPGGELSGGRQSGGRRFGQETGRGGF